MKKILFVAALVFATAFSSCGNRTESSEVNDTTAVDTVVVDTIAVDSADMEVANSVSIDSLVAGTCTCK